MRPKYVIRHRMITRGNTSMAVSIDFTPGRTIRWHKRRFVVVDHTGFDAILAREVGKCRIERLPIREVKPDHAIILTNARLLQYTSYPFLSRIGGPPSNNSQSSNR